MHTTIALAALAAAAPALANDAWEEANRELAWRVNYAVSRDNTESAEVPDAVKDAQGFLIGGGTEYAPYEVPCPTGVTWIRPATEVSCVNRRSSREPLLRSAADTLGTKDTR